MKNNTIKKVAVPFLGSILALGALAVNADNQYQPNSNNQYYLSLQAGYGGMNTIDGKSGSLGEGAASFRFSGGYLFAINNNLQIGPELGYFAYPKYTYTIGSQNVADFKGYTIDLLANARYHFNNQWYGFAKAGAAYATQESNVYPLPGVSVNTKKSTILPEVSAGLGYSFNKNVSLDLSYTHIFGQKDAKADKVATVSAWLLGVNYAF